MQDFSNKYLINSMVVGARQSCQFFTQSNWFLGNKRAFLNSGIGFALLN